MAGRSYPREAPNDLGRVPYCFACGRIPIKNTLHTIMNVSIILGHPTQGSFNHALADTAAAALRKHGYTVHFHDLYQESFDPMMRTEELAKGSPVPAGLEAHCSEILAADGIVIVHPNWWCNPPAVLKGWVDRVLRAGMAYRFESDGQGGSRSVGLLKAKAALVITTANNPQDKEIEMYGDPLEIFWKKVVFGLCGVRNVRRLIFAPVILSSLEQRQGWLRETEEAVGKLFS